MPPALFCFSYSSDRAWYYSLGSTCNFPTYASCASGNTDMSHYAWPVCWDGVSLPGLTLNYYPPNLCLQYSWDYRNESPHPAENECFTSYSISQHLSVIKDYSQPSFELQTLFYPPLFLVLGIEPGASCSMAEPHRSPQKLFRDPVRFQKRKTSHFFPTLLHVHHTVGWGLCPALWGVVASGKSPAPAPWQGQAKHTQLVVFPHSRLS
jgi:hypothetical protein